jgi:hypothetical protein
MLHPRVWLLACMGWCMVWILPAQASWEAYQQAGEAAYKRGDYATARRMFLAAVREARDFGPQDPRLDISLNKLELLRLGQSTNSTSGAHPQRATRRKSHTRKPGQERRGHQRQAARAGERRTGTRNTVARPAHRAKRPPATLHRARPARHGAPPVRHGKRREAVQTPHRQRSHTLQRSRTTQHHTGKTTGRRSLTRSRHE